MHRRRRPSSSRIRRLPVRRRYPWWWYSAPPWILYSPNRSNPTPPRWVTLPAMDRYRRGARATLARSGLLTGVWIDRLAGADSRLVRFVNRYYRTPGFDHVVRAYFGGRYRRSVARLAMRLADRLTARSTDFSQTIHFTPDLGVGSGGSTVRSVGVVYRGVHHMLNPWPRVSGPAIGRLMDRSQTLFGRPEAVRWVFDGGRLNMTRRDLLAELRRGLRGARLLNRRDRDRWVRALPTVGLVV